MEVKISTAQLNLRRSAVLLRGLIRLQEEAGHPLNMNEVVMSWDEKNLTITYLPQ